MADKTERYLKNIDTTLKSIERELKKLNKRYEPTVKDDHNDMHVKRIKLSDRQS